MMTIEEEIKFLENIELQITMTDDSGMSHCGKSGALRLIREEINYRIQALERESSRAEKAIDEIPF